MPELLFSLPRITAPAALRRAIHPSILSHSTSSAHTLTNAKLKVLSNLSRHVQGAGPLPGGTSRKLLNSLLALNLDACFMPPAAKAAHTAQLVLPCPSALLRNSRFNVFPVLVLGKLSRNSMECGHL